MSSGFLAIDRAALGLCDSEPEVVCLMLMMRRQDQRWTKADPFPDVEVGRSYWSARTGLSEWDVRKFVDRLVAGGRAVVTHPGDRKTTRRIRLLVDMRERGVSTNLPPTHEQPQTPNTGEIHQPSTNLPPQGSESDFQIQIPDQIPPTPRGVTEDEDGPRDDRAAHAAAGAHPQSPNPERPAPLAPAPRRARGRAAGSGDHVEDLDELFSLLAQASPHTRGQGLTDDRRRALQARIREHGADSIRTVAAWIAAGADKRARFLRDEHGDVTTLLRPTKFPDYLDFARTWDAAGRPLTSPARPVSRGTSRQDQERALLADLDNDLLATLPADLRAIPAWEG